MPVVDHARYCQMLDRARKGRFAYPAVNVTSLTTANAVLQGLARSRSDGIIQVSTGGAAFASGAGVSWGSSARCRRSVTPDPPVRGRCRRRGRSSPTA
jgi:fructose/tagatose bisphosphate aldolase